MTQFLKKLLGKIGAKMIHASSRELGRPLHPSSHYLGDNKILFVTNLNHRLILNTKDLSLTPTVLTTGEWESDTTHILSWVVKPGMVVIEIGANVGFHTMYLARLVGAKGKIYAFEPNLSTHAFLADNINLNFYNNIVQTYKIALSDKEGTMVFNKLKSHSGSSSLLEVPPPFISRLQDEVEKISVQVSTLDDVVRKNSITKVDLIKMDVEGSEYFIFDGMKEVLRSNPNIQIICEYNAEILNYNKISAEMFFKKISEFGFEPWYIEQGKFRKFDIKSIGSKTFIDLYLKRPNSA